MTAGDQPLTFIVRLFRADKDGVRGVIERVGTGWKDAVTSPEDVARVIAAALEERHAARPKTRDR